MIKQLFTEFPLTDVPQERTVTEEKIRKYTYTKNEVDVLISASFTFAKVPKGQY